MFSDPQTVTIASIAIPLTRITLDAGVGTFTSADGKLVMTIRQSKSATRLRHEVRLTQTKVATDPISAVNKEISTSVIMTIDEPSWGFSDTELDQLKDGLVAWYIDTNTNKLLVGES